MIKKFRVIKVFNDIKTQSRNLVLNKYKFFIVPILLYELFSVIIISILNFGFSKIFSGEINYLLSALLIFLWLLIELLVLPVLVMTYFKICIFITEDKKSTFSVIKSLLTRRNILNIVLISLIPNIFKILNSLIKFFKNYYDDTEVYYSLSFILLIIIFIIQYKFFICNYFFALHQSSVKETLKVSFNTMNGVFVKYIIYELSFILWNLLIIIIGLAAIYISKIFNIELKYLQLAIPSGFGVMFYYRPYKFLVDLLYAKKLLLKYNSGG